MFQLFGSLRSWLTIAVLVIGGPVLVVAGFSEARQHAALADHGKSAVAVVDGVSWKEKRLSGREKGFKIQVHFDTDTKQTVHTELSVSKELGQRLRDTPGDPTVELRYLPEDPQRAELAGTSDSSTGLYVIGAGMFLVGGFLAFRRLKATPATAPA